MQDNMQQAGMRTPQLSFRQLVMSRLAEPLPGGPRLLGVCSHWCSACATLWELLRGPDQARNCVPKLVNALLTKLHQFHKQYNCQ